MKHKNIDNYSLDRKKHKKVGRKLTISYFYKLMDSRNSNQQ